MSKNLDKLRHYTDSIRNQALSLRDISDAFYMTGNEKMSETLTGIADSLLDCSVNINQAIGNEVTEQFKRAQESSANLVKAALSVGMKRKDK